MKFSASVCSAIGFIVSSIFCGNAIAAVVYNDDTVTAEVYGRAEFNVADSGDEVSGVGYARFGFKGRSYIAEGLDAVVRGEWDIVAESSTHNEQYALQNGLLNSETGEVTGYVSADRSGVLAARHVYAGFEVGEYGRLIFGQTETAFYDAVSFTDIFNSYGFNGSEVIYVGRQEGQAIYTADLLDFHFSASYQFRDEDAKLQLSGTNGNDLVIGGSGSPVVLKRAFATTLGYSSPFGVSVYGAYSQEQYEGGTKKNWAGSTNYIKDEVYLAAVVAQSTISDSKLTGYEAVVGYDLSPLFVYGGYNKQRAEQIALPTVISGTETLSVVSGNSADNWVLGTQFDFNAHLIGWVEYKFENATRLSDGTKMKDNWTVAIQYNF